MTVVSQESGDPAAVIFDAVGAARARKIDVMMADTAGRLPTQLHLMEELRKVKRVIGKAQDGAPHELLLVIDANTGQNALAQVKAFDDALGLTGLIVTKLDGTAKGGILAAIARQRPIPVYFIGVGEKVEDLQPFSAEEFADALLGLSDELNAPQRRSTRPKQQKGHSEECPFCIPPCRITDRLTQRPAARRAPRGQTRRVASRDRRCAGWSETSPCRP